MTKFITIDPSEARQKSVIKSKEIPVNAYVSNPQKETQKYGQENLVYLFGVDLPRGMYTKYP